MKALRTFIVFSVVAAAHAAPPLPGLFDLTIANGMPNLDENLRYATTRERRCVSADALPVLFPVLVHEALQDCRLAGERRDGDAITYELRCTGGHGTTGSARWQIDAQTLHGSLDVKLGGKNMTFWQRITARRVGDCAAPG